MGLRYGDRYGVGDLGSDRSGVLDGGAGDGDGE